MRTFYSGFLLVLCVGLFQVQTGALACESCAVPRLGRERAADRTGGKVYVDLTTEQQVWRARSARDAHELHHQGHHVHNKTHEELYHFIVGGRPMDRLEILADIPYVSRSSSEIDDHRRLGARETSEGWGDMNLLATYWFYDEGGTGLGGVAGVKLPTGSTDETNSTGVLFEPELQPGSGSTDVPLGGVYRFALGSVVLRGNAVYVIKTRGAQDFEHGDLFTTSLFVDVPLVPKGSMKVTPGLELNFQHEGRSINDGVREADSGGDLLLLGPSLAVQATPNLSLFGNFLFPAYQDPGGFHQTLRYVWNLGAKIGW